MVHRSHISSKHASAQGWSRVPSPTVRAETYSMTGGVGTEFMSGNYAVWNDCDSSVRGNTATWTTTWGDSSGGTSANEYWYVDTPNTTPTITTIREIIKEREVTKEVETRTLYRVYVVDPRKGGKILLNGEAVIALNENQAMLKVGIAKIASDIGREIEQLDVYVEEVGTFIRPRKETQRVKITKEDEED